MTSIVLPERGYRRSRLMDSTGLVITVPGLNGEVFGPFDFSVSAATRNCPETATKLPAGGPENCPLTVTGSARHDVVCLAAVRG